MQIQVKQDVSRLRPAEVLQSAGDASKLKQETGWRTTIPLVQTLRELLDYWKLAVGKRRFG